MKKYLLIIVLHFIFFSSIAQTHTINIFCTVDEKGNANYTRLGKLLPDSLQNEIIINYRKKYIINRGDDVLLGMTLDGWKLVNTFSIAANNLSYLSYMLSKEILLNEATYQLYIENLKNIEGKK